MEFAAFQSVCIIMLMFAFSCAFSVSKDCAHEFDMTYRKMLDIEIDRIERRFEAKLSEIQIRMQNGENRLTKEIRTLKKQLHNERLNNWKNTARFGQKLADIKYHILVEKRENYSKPDIKWITIKDIETVPVKGYMTYNTTLNGVTCKGRNTDRAHKIDRNRLIQGEIAKTIPLKPDEEYETTLEDDNAKKPLSRFGRISLNKYS